MATALAPKIRFHHVHVDLILLLPPSHGNREKTEKTANIKVSLTSGIEKRDRWPVKI